jgi:DNA-binding transcriptional regulator GbsR (MarR family)
MSPLIEEGRGGVQTGGKVLEWLDQLASHLYVQNVLNDDAREVWDSFVDLGGRAAQRLGLARSLGQIYAALYLSPQPLALQDLMDQLQISKGGASMSVRQLADWGAVERVWVKGDRKDYWQAKDDFRHVLRHILSVLLKPRLDSTHDQLEGMQATLRESDGKTDPDVIFMRKRIAKLESFQGKLKKILPIAEKLL